MMEYNDRGRLKWVGFYLSYHTEEISKVFAATVKNRFTVFSLFTRSVMFY
ncbi:hypothetical protein [Enterococcus faecium]|nr:hypothetical protein [Enterococcus faecium]